MKKVLAILAGLALMLGMSLSLAQIAKAVAQNGGGDGQVTICHRTNSVTNPYRVEEPDKSGDVAGHADHIGPVFNPNTVYPPPHNGDQWGDIIPPFDYSGGHFDGLNWPEGQTILENDCVASEQEEFQVLTVEADCSDPAGLTKWIIDNPNNVDINFTWELYLVGGSPVQDSGSGQVLASSSTIVQTQTPGDVRLTIYWCDPAKLPGSCDTLHACATNENVEKVCTPPVTDLCTNLAGIQTSLLPGVVRLEDGSCISYGKSSPKPGITPQVLGTVAPAVGGTTENLPTSGANDTSLYWLTIIVSSGLLYYMKAAGWKKIGVK